MSHVSMISSLSMLRTPIDMARLAQWSNERGFGWTSRRSAKGFEIGARFDEGRALHHLLTEVFGPRALPVFRLMVGPTGRGAHLYAYTEHPINALFETARASADPGHLSIVGIDHAETKSMPTIWREGQLLGFDLKTRPTVRIHSELPHPRDQQPYRPGAELDAYLVEAIRRFPEERASISADGVVSSGMQRERRTHEAVYLDWLAKRLEPGATLIPERTRLAQHRRTRASRRREAVDGPEAVFHGTLSIADPTEFQRRLAKGTGRHKAYGYGMLLLRPPQAAPFSR